MLSVAVSSKRTLGNNVDLREIQEERQMRTMEEIDELNRLRKEVDRLSRRNQKLEAENVELTLKVSKYINEPIEETNEITHATKLNLLTRICKYGLGHFCDGTPNKSGGEQEYLPPCPDYEYCTIRRKRVYKPKGEE